MEKQYPDWDKRSPNNKRYNHERYMRFRDRCLARERAKYWKDPVAGAAKEAAKRAVAQEGTPSLYMWRHIRSRAKRKGIEFTIEPSDIIIPERCPLLDIPLFFGTNKSNANSPTLDRIDNDVGYVKGNIWVISHRANTMKHNCSLEELVAFSHRVIEKWGTTHEASLVKIDPQRSLVLA